MSRIPGRGRAARFVGRDDAGLHPVRLRGLGDDARLQHFAFFVEPVGANCAVAGAHAAGKRRRAGGGVGHFVGLRARHRLPAQIGFGVHEQVVALLLREVQMVFTHPVADHKDHVLELRFGLLCRRGQRQREQQQRAQQHSEDSLTFHSGCSFSPLMFKSYHKRRGKSMDLRE